MEPGVEKPPVRRRNSIDLPPYLSELRMVLLGKNCSEISRVGNLILGREAFNTEAPPPSVKQSSERAGGIVQDTYITIISSPHLFTPQLSTDELNQRVRECMTLSSPGPHVLLLVLQTEDFTQTDRRRLNYILHCLSEDPHKHILVIRTEKLQSDCSVDPAEEKSSQSFITGFSNRCFQLNRESSSSDLVEMLKKIDEENRGSFLKWEEYEDAPEQQQHDITSLRRLSQRLNVVLCGSNRVLKSPISDLILGQSELSPESSSECVIRKAEVFGRLIHLVELPALYNSQLSEKEVMQETLHCVSLCDPGVHAFLFIVPEGCLTDEDKGELKKMQRIFGSRIKNHTIAIITGSEQHAGELDAATEPIIQTFKRHVCVSDANMRSELLQQIEQMTQNYTTMMYVETQVETQLKYKSEIESIKLSDVRNETQGTGDLTVVLVGKTGMGKSASGNTILGRKAFKELMSFQSVTTMCKKESAELRRGRVTVIDTPGLCDTNISKEENIKEIARCITMATPGPHVFLLVLTVGRFTQEEKDSVKTIQELFGEESSKYTMVLFTRGDDLDQSIEEMISASDYSLQNLIYQCGHRYHVFNNRNPKNRSQVTDLLEKIDSMVAVNGGSRYTNEMFQKVEKALQEEQERILKEKNEELERDKEKLKAKHEAELENLKKIMEDKRKKLEEERREKEEEFKKREARIKEESNEALKKELKEQREAFDKEMERKEQANTEKMQKDLQYQEQKYNREKESIRKQSEEKARRQAEEEFCVKLEKENKKITILSTAGAAVGGAAGLVAGPFGAVAGAAAGAAIGNTVLGAAGAAIGVLAGATAAEIISSVALRCRTPKNKSA